MKKVAVLAAIVAVAALAAPALSATNPFMDVPMNHWAYDAIGQLAAHGILSGYPDGLYKGKQQTTRYEMASALARALAVVDMTKASKQDVEMLKRLVVEFKDELEALGVQVAELDERVAVLENRLGGWHIHGVLDFDVKYRSAEDARSQKGDGSMNFDAARLFFERTFGENDEYFFRARLRDEDGKKGAASTIRMDRFYVEMPFFMDTKLTVGRFLWDVDTAYRPSVPATGSWTGGDSVLTDTVQDGFGIEKNFGLGAFRAYISHPDRMPDNFVAYDATKYPHGINKSEWELFAMADLQFTENVGLDLGVQAFIGDNSSTRPTVSRTGVNEYLNAVDDVNFKNLWTVFAGLRFNFNDAIAIKGSFYHQQANSEIAVADAAATYGARWADYGYGFAAKGNNAYADDANHWRAIIDVKQEALKFTSVWLEYGQYGKGFWVPQGMSTIFPTESSILKEFVSGGSQTAADLKYWRVVLGQQWNEKWATHLFYYGYKVEDYYPNAAGNWESPSPAEFGVGVQYKLNDATTMGLNYTHVKSDLPTNATRTEDKDNIVRFRTSISF